MIRQSSGNEEVQSNGEMSSSDDENDISDDLVAKIFGSYDGPVNKEVILRSGPNSCLICISSVKRTDAVWSCQNCFCVMHMQCIQRWANDSIFQQKSEAQREIGKTEKTR